MLDYPILATKGAIAPGVALVDVVPSLQDLVSQASIVVLGCAIRKALFATVVWGKILYATTIIQVNAASRLLVLLLAAAAEHHVLGGPVDAFTELTLSNKFKIDWGSVVVDIIPQRDVFKNGEIPKKIISSLDLVGGRLGPRKPGHLYSGDELLCAFSARN